MNKRDLEKLVKEQVMYLQSVCPVDTGNLKASIKYRETSPLVWEIYVDCGDDPFLKAGTLRGIAPYMPFTNEAWVSDHWKGKQNPNLYWWNIGCNAVLTNLQKKLNGKLERAKNINVRK